MGKLSDFFKSTSFLEKALLLLLTAGLSGLLIPLITSEVAHRNMKEQKQLEAQLARQASVIEAQVQLLETLADLLWEYQLLAIDVSYYRFAKDENLYRAAAKKYDNRSASLLSRIRAEISKSLRLSAPQMYERLKGLYNKELLGLDLRLRNLMEGHKNDWSAFNQYAVWELSETVDNVLNDLAADLELKAPVKESEENPGEE